jgi:hypothetical protein
MVWCTMHVVFPRRTSDKLDSRQHLHSTIINTLLIISTRRAPLACRRPVF